MNHVEASVGRQRDARPSLLWGIHMVSHICEATTKAALKRELQRVWREEITPEVCQKCIRHYFMFGGTLDRCIAANGKRFSRGALQD